MVPEAPMEETEVGLVPAGEGWFVLNAREARWRDDGPLGKMTFFEGDAGNFEKLGINAGVLEPGQPMAMYQWENEQEDFLVLTGEPLLIVEGEERQLKPWDLVHCPEKTNHVIVGAGEGPSVIVSVGTRVASGDWGAYTVDAAALRHGAGVEEETTLASEAYARFPDERFTPYEDGWLPDVEG
ncbi:MAG TPA: cupin domain-containing protein [Gaiellaceae bacterium]|nr:cupin domain-containing protein [Gaiellaceae bacterium]